MQSAEYQRRPDDAREATAEVADAQQDVIAALKAAGIDVAPPQPLADRPTVGFSCSPEAARVLASWVRQHTDGTP
jgi:hypothetical protein